MAYTTPILLQFAPMRALGRLFRCMMMYAASRCEGRRLHASAARRRRFIRLTPMPQAGFHEPASTLTHARRYRPKARHFAEIMPFSILLLRYCLPRHDAASTREAQIRNSKRVADAMTHASSSATSGCRWLLRDTYARNYASASGRC